MKNDQLLRTSSISSQISGLALSLDESMFFFSFADAMLSFSSLIFLNYNFLGGLFENDSFIKALLIFGLNLLLSQGNFLQSFLFEGLADDDSLLDNSLELEIDEDRLDFTLSILSSKISFLGINLKLLASILNLLIDELLYACLSYSL